MILKAIQDKVDVRQGTKQKRPLLQVIRYVIDLPPKVVIIRPFIICLTAHNIV